MVTDGKMTLGSACTSVVCTGTARQAHGRSVAGGMPKLLLVVRIAGDIEALRTPNVIAVPAKRNMDCNPTDDQHKRVCVMGRFAG